MDVTLPSTDAAQESAAKTAAPARHPHWEPSTFDLDGLRLGASISDFGSRHRASICDDDPIENGRRHVWFFAACNHAQPLPGGTVLAALAAPVEEGTSPAGEVTAIAWFGGNWPTSTGTFPVELGATRAATERALGAGQRLFDFKGVLVDGEHIVVYRHGERLYSVLRDDAAIGFVIGRMSADRNKEEWRGLVGNALRQVRTAAR